MILLIGSVVVIFSTIFMIYILMQKYMAVNIVENKLSERIVYSFLPDNSNPAVTEMINYHKKNELVEYEL